MSPWQEPPETFVGCAVQGQHVLIAGQTTASASQGVVMLFSSVTSKKKNEPKWLGHDRIVQGRKSWTCDLSSCPDCHQVFCASVSLAVE